jgi:enterochelin esterase-like enzyme
VDKVKPEIETLLLRKVQGCRYFRCCPAALKLLWQQSSLVTCPYRFMLLTFLFFLLSPLMAQTPEGIPAAELPKRIAATKWVNEPKTTLPRGVIHKTFFSKALNADVGYLVYLPPDYETSPGRRYPVIYNLHGAGGNELHSLEEAQFLDEGIRTGKLPPMIMAMPNGGIATMYQDSYDGKWPAETLIIREFIPFIDKSYRTVARREGRAIEGFSMGGRGATRLAMKYPEMFCSLFDQSGNVVHTSEEFKPSDAPSIWYLGPDKQRYIENDAYLLLQKNLDRIKGRMRIQVWCGTQDPGHLVTVRQFHQALLDAGVDHTYMEIEGLAHKHNEVLARYSKIWFDYHVESFKRSGALGN